MSRPGTWQPGQSGNPAGRPIKNKALTEILRQAGNRTLLDKATDKNTARKRVLARLLWQLATEGMATMPDNETELRLDPGDWVGLVKWLYTHLDGPPPSRHELAGVEDQPLIIKIVYDDTDTDDDQGINPEAA